MVKVSEENGFKLISAISIDNEGNEITLCAKDIILSPFAFFLDQESNDGGTDDHNFHMFHSEMNEDRRLSKYL